MVCAGGCPRKGTDRPKGGIGSPNGKSPATVRRAVAGQEAANARSNYGTASNASTHTQAPPELALRVPVTSIVTVWEPAVRPVTLYSTCCAF